MSNGTITVYYGPMGSGKTQSLCTQLCDISDIMPWKVLFINHASDTRDVSISTHNRSGFSARERMLDTERVIKKSAERLAEVDVTGYNIVGVDEGQFFTDLRLVEQWRRRGINIIIAGLLQTKDNEVFGEMGWAIANADKIYHTQPMCIDCSRKNIKTDALFTAGPRDGPVIMVGGLESYRPLCRSCHDKHLGLTPNYL